VFEHLAGSGRLGGTGARQLLRQRRHFGAGQGVASTALKRSRRRCNALTHTPGNARGALATLAVMVSSFLPRHNLSVATLRTTSTGWLIPAPRPTCGLTTMSEPGVCRRRSPG
jgi:hypothetical protein